MMCNTNYLSEINKIMKKYMFIIDKNNEHIFIHI